MKGRSQGMKWKWGRSMKQVERTRSLMGKLRITDERQSEHVRNDLEKFWRLRPDAAEGF